MLPRVFDLFTQVDRTLDRAQGGLGIGLTLVEAAWSSCTAGTVAAASDGPGQGSEFIVRLPASSRRTRRVRRRRVPGRRAKPGTRAAAACSSSTTTSTLRRVLGAAARADWATTVAGRADDGAAAIEAARASSRTSCCSTSACPGWTATSVARRLRRTRGRDGSVLVALTGYGQEEDRERAREAASTSTW